MKNKVYYSDDYAGLKAGDLDFYYGYEVEEKGEWCFQVKKGEVVLVTLTTSEIQSVSDPFQLDDPKDFLLAGIGMFLAKVSL